MKKVRDFEVKITRKKTEIEAAQRLRFEVFNLEMHKGLQASYERGLDVDPYDSACEHLIVRDSKHNRIVGTYRLLLGSRTNPRLGFYSEQEFDLRRIKNLKGELLELGRSCVHREYRDRALIEAMWQTIAEYIRRHDVRYLFGCASLTTTDAREVSGAFGLFKQQYYAPENRLRVSFWRRSG
jgi:putative hemolysin